jgi:NAD(P)-dependent dehydrogenase (short-subunit alcohol dehydrogenase family)
MAGRVEGKVALITGGGSGIGRATALLFGREGAKVLVADYNAESGERTVKTIREAGGTAVFHPADVSNPQDVDALIHKVVERYGRLDSFHRISRGRTGMCRSYGRCAGNGGARPQGESRRNR